MTIVPLAEAGMVSDTMWSFGRLLFLLANLTILPLIFLFSRQVSRRFDFLIRKMETFRKKEMELGPPLTGKGIIGEFLTRGTYSDE